jgi:4,5-DOPA dioxygenase extradiol
MLPAFFIAHGSPMLAIEENAYTRFLRGLGASMKPRAILLFSAHWESPIQMVSGVDRYRTIHDFGGFPQALYQVTYPARGDRQVTEAVTRLLSQEGIPVRIDESRGLDHGAWVILSLLYPNADVPVVALSVNAEIPPHEQYRIGQALSGLRADDVLVIASGGSVHNFSTMRMRAGSDQPDGWAVEFDDWVVEKAAAWDLKSLFAYESLAPHARIAVPPHGKEHFIPLFYAMGAADDQRSARELHRSYLFGNLSHAVWQFGE